MVSGIYLPFGRFFVKSFKEILVAWHVSISLANIANRGLCAGKNPANPVPSQGALWSNSRDTVCLALFVDLTPQKMVAGW
jgi:hypothetical protein